MALTLLEPIIVNTAANFTFANASITSNITAGNVKTDNLLYANGAPYIFTTSAAGSNTQVQFNDANAFAGSANFTFNKTTNTLSVTNIIANGSGLTSLNGSNITGQVANALVAGTVYTAAQPNITSVGLLTSLSVGPNSSITLTGTSGFIKANSIQGTDGVNAVYPGYNGVSGAAGITSDLTVGIGAAGNITANGNVTASYFIGNGSSLSSIAGGNITGQVANALVAGTVYTNAQPNITSIGTLTNLSVSGNASVDGNLVVGGNLVYINVETLRIEDPIIELGGGVNGAPLTSNDNKDRGTILHYYTTAPVDAFMGWDNSNAEFGFGSNVSVTGEVVTFTSYGNVRVGYIIGNGSQLSSINASSVTSGTLDQTRLANSSLTINGTSISLGSSGTITANTTQTLTLGAYLTGTSFDGGTAVTANVDATSANTANKIVARDASGNFSAGTITATLSGAATTAGTVTTAAQPNITSVGLLTALSIGPNSSLTMTGTSGFVRANSIQGNDATNAIYPTYNGVAGAVGITGNLTVGIGIAANITANGNVTANYFIGNGSSLNSISGANITGAVAYATTANSVAVANVVGIGNISTINLDGNASNVLYGNGVFAAVGGGYGNDNVATFLASFGSNTITTTGNVQVGNIIGNGQALTGLNGANVTGQVANALVAGTVYTAAQPNITSLGTLSSLSVSGAAVFSGLSSLFAARDRFSYITSASGTSTHDLNNGAVFYHLLPGGSFTPDFTNVDTTDNYTTVVVLFIQQGATPYVPGSTITINSGAALAVKWLSATAPTGTANGYDMISYSLIRNLGNWVILGQSASFS